MPTLATMATITTLAASLARAQSICQPLDAADAGKVSYHMQLSCEDNPTDNCVEACVSFYEAPNECTQSIGDFDGSESLWVYDVLQNQTFKVGQDATSVWRGWTASFAPGTTSLPDPDPQWPGSGIYLAWDYGLFGFVYDIPHAERFVPERIQFAIRFAEEEDVQGIFVDATC